MSSTRPTPPPLPAPLTSLVGRGQEIAAVGDLLARRGVRVLTLTGAPGVGKTRLALAAVAAAGTRADFPDGVWFVPLAPVTDPELVLPAVAAALGLRATDPTPPLERLVAHLSGKGALLVLDNFEQVLGAALPLAALLAQCPGLTVLVTSRTALRLAGEQEFPVPPLRVPGAGPLLPVEGLLEYEAVRLFVERGQAVAPAFALAPENAAAVAEVCRRLDGIPLALELAAARLTLFQPDALRARLTRRLPLLTDGPRDAPARQQTLRAAMDWSHRLLAPAQQVLLRRLAVFAGGCTLEAAEQVCPDPAGTSEAGAEGGARPADSPLGADIIRQPEVLDLLAALRRASLVGPAPGPDGDEVRIELLETLREYALERLVESGEREAVRDRHAAFFLALAQRPLPDGDPVAPADGAGPPERRDRPQGEPLTWERRNFTLRRDMTAQLDRLQADVGNFREALAWQLSRGEPEPALRLSLALYPLWEYRGYGTEGRRWVERALAAADNAAADGVPLVLRASALDALAALSGRRLDFPAARALLERSLALLRTLGDQLRLAHGTLRLGTLARAAGDYAAARAYLEEAGALYTAQGDAVESERCRLWLGSLARNEGKYDRARSLLQRSLAYFRALTAPADPVAVGWCQLQLGNADCDEGDPAAARQRFKETLTLARDGRHLPNAATGLLGAARWAAAVGQTPSAARLLAAATALREARQHPWPPVDRPDYDEVMGRLRAALDPAALEAQLDEGRSMGPWPAVAHALEVLDAAEEPAGDGGARLPADSAASAATAANVTNGAARRGAPLTARQREVAALVAQGLTNREIAEQLVITERTAENHVGHVLTRLGFRSRAQIGTWLAGHRPPSADGRERAG
jgi:non-specific serine/threonine protein kinase